MNLFVDLVLVSFFSYPLVVMLLLWLLRMEKVKNQELKDMLSSYKDVSELSGKEEEYESNI